MKKTSQYLFLMTMGLSTLNQSIQAEPDAPIMEESPFQFQIAEEPKSESPASSFELTSTSPSVTTPSGISSSTEEEANKFINELPEEERKKVQEISKNSLVKQILIGAGITAAVGAAILYAARTGKLDILAKKFPSLQGVIGKVTGLSNKLAPYMTDLFGKAYGSFKGIGKRAGDTVSGLANSASKFGKGLWGKASSLLNSKSPGSEIAKGLALNMVVNKALEKISPISPPSDTTA